MINYDSILSAFDGKPTLLQWLKMVKKALDESVLKDITVSQDGASAVFTFNFEDGTSISTPEVILPKGDSTEVLQTTGQSTTAVMSQKAVTDNLSFQNEEIEFNWHRKQINMPGVPNTIFPSDIGDSITRILNIETTSENGYDITDKTMHISVENGYKYACVLYRHGKTDETFNHLVYEGEWKFYTEPTIWVANGDYKYLLVMLAKTDDSEILLTDSSSIKIEIEDKVTNDVKERIKLLQKNHELITLPFSDFLIDFHIYKENGNYCVSTKPTDYFVKKDNGKVVFISPNGSDSADGLTALTPVKTLNKALSISSVETIIFLEGEYIANTNFNIGTEIGIPVNFIGIGNVVIDNISGSNNAPINFKSPCYVRNIHFKHGNNTVKATLSNNEVAVFDKCIFSDSDGALWSNGLSILGGISYIFNCIAYNNAYDGFNYHANESVINYAFEIGCKSYNNGNINLLVEHGQSSNATTSHEGAYIVRVNGDYYACHGGVVADLNSHSANYGCKAGVSTVTNETSYADRMSNYWCSGSQMYMYDCTSYGSKYDTAIVNNGTIISNIQYSSNYQS